MYHQLKQARQCTKCIAFGYVLMITIWIYIVIHLDKQGVFDEPYQSPITTDLLCRNIDSFCLLYLWKTVGCRTSGEVYNAIIDKKYNHPQIQYWISLANSGYVKNDMAQIKFLAKDHIEYSTIC